VWSTPHWRVFDCQGADVMLVRAGRRIEIAMLRDAAVRADELQLELQ